MNPEDLTPEEREYIAAEEAVIRSAERERLLYRKITDVEKEVRSIEEKRCEWLRSLAAEAAGFPLTTPLPVAPPVSGELIAVLSSLGAEYGAACAAHTQALRAARLAKSNLRRS